jgi:non-ribosomal peptide synthetase-like protein
LINGYRAHNGLIQTGSVTLGKDVFIGEHTVLDIESSMGDGAQLGHSSSLHLGQAVPDGGRWHGSPAQETTSNYRRVDPADCGPLRRVSYPILQILSLVALLLPLAMGGGVLLLISVPHLSALLDPESMHLTSATFYGQAVVASLVLYFGYLLVGILVTATVPRVLRLAIKPDQTYSLYGWHYAVHRRIARMTNRKVYPFILGDSSYIVHYLRWIGYKLPDLQQTGSNFGQVVKHETPYLTTVGSGTVVADGLSVINADFSSTSFQVSHAKIGRHNFLGNNIAYPSQGRTGDNCLLATKVMVPIDGKIRENVGLLGSPSFEIPRTVDRDSDFALESTDALHHRLAAKNKHNIVTMGLYLLMQWLFILIGLLIATAGADVYHLFGASVISLVIVVNLLVRVGYRVLFERCFRSMQALRPNGCSIYDLGFWRHERYWKFCEATYLMAFNGTPFKPMIWRMLGVRLGRRAFDDGLGVVEKTFVTIGDDCTFNAGSIIQCHSQEDGAFKSDLVAIANGVTLGVGAFVHYGVTIGDDAELAADSFLMKGEDMPANAHWGGNPAGEMSKDESSALLPRLHQQIA